MSTTTLNAIAIDVVGQYAEAARHLVEAYRIGTQRTITGLGGGYARFVEAGQLPLISDELKTSLIEGEQRIVGLAVDAIDRASEQAQKVVAGVSTRAVESMEAFDEKTAWADEMMVVGAVRKLNLPAAKLSLKVATRANEASARLSERVASFGNGTAKAAAAKPAPAAKRATRRTRKAA